MKFIKNLIKLFSKRGLLPKDANLIETIEIINNCNCINTDCCCLDPLSLRDAQSATIALSNAMKSTAASTDDLIRISKELQAKSLPKRGLLLKTQDQ